MTQPEMIAAVKTRLICASGADREIDLALAAAMGEMNHAEAEAWTRFIEGRADHIATPKPPKRYTASIDTALALLESRLPGVFYMLGKGRTRAAEPLYGFQIMFGSDEILADAEHDHAPNAVLIALCMALLSTRAGVKAA